MQKKSQRQLHSIIIVFFFLSYFYVLFPICLLSRSKMMNRNEVQLYVNQFREGL